ncbi:MAG: DUF6279 family lipoprotein [Polaromonas sp.]|nr:DUF6279 family lipoprotein [Polaromonas sp.]
MGRIIGVLLLAGLVGGCASIKLAYNQAPELMYLYIDRYFDFDSEQKPLVKTELTQLQAWHRKTQLPVYIETLQKLQPRMTADYSATQACEIVTDVRVKMRAVASHIEPGAARLALQFDDAQFAQMEKKFARDNAKFRNEYLDATPAQMRKKRVKDATDRAEKLYGRLEKRQLEVLFKTIADSRFDAKVAYTERLRRQAMMLQTLRGLVDLPQRDDSAAQQRAVAAVAALMQQPFVSADPDYRRYVQAQTQESCQAFADLHNSTSPEQRQQAVKTLKQYEEDFRALANPTSG